MEPSLTPTTYLVALVEEGGSAPPTLGAVRRLAERGHRVVVLADAARAVEIRAAGAEHRPWDGGPAGAAAAADATCRAIGELRPDAVVVAGPVLGALVAAERATVPLGLLVAGAALSPARREERARRGLLPELNEVRAAHGLEPLGRATDQLHRADRHVEVTGAVDAIVDALEALPGCRPWLLVERHDPAQPVARELQLAT
jgi:hypothetical protein